jgi:hypothetical protein
MRVHTQSCAPRTLRECARHRMFCGATSVAPHTRRSRCDVIHVTVVLGERGVCVASRV